jgi:hypothetical protein
VGFELEVQSNSRTTTEVHRIVRPRCSYGLQSLFYAIVAIVRNKIAAMIIPIANR